jgi:pseudaminic acid synthase
MHTTVIAEIGSNWKTLDDILFSCEWVIEHGCLPKLQAWVTKRVVNRRRYQSMYEVMKKYELPHKWIRSINAKFPNTFYSVFDLESLAFLETEIKPIYYKIASPDAVHKPLVQAVASCGRNTIVSLGGCTLDEIRWVAKQFEWHKLTLMECNASYPAKLAYLGNLRDRIVGSRLIPWGYSDHTLSTNVPAFAVTLGATMIEKHFNLKEFDSPDNGHSLGQIEFETMIDRIKKAEEHMGTKEHPYPEEVNTMELARRKGDGLR